MPRDPKKNVRVRTGGFNAIQRRDWDIGKALTLRLANKLSYQQIADVMKTSKQAITRGLAPLLSLLDVDPKLLQGFREQEPNLMDAVRMLAMQGMGEQLSDPKRRQKMDLMRLNLIYGTLFDKQRLARGESTANIHQLTSIISAAHKESEPEPDGGTHTDSSTQPSG